MKRAPWLLITVFLLAAGCVSPEKMQELRGDCVVLTTGSFTAIPSCDSQETCYKKVQSELFGFDETVFDFSSRRSLSAYKNFVAQSWLFFNESQVELEKIRDLCWNAENMAELPAHVNRLNRALIRAFSAADEADKRVFVFLVAQKEWLQQQELGLVREEPLFADSVLIQNNLNEFQSKDSQPTDSLAQKMKTAQAHLDAVFSQYGFEKRFVSTQQLADALPEYRQQIFRTIPQDIALVPAFASMVVELASQFSTQQRLQESVESLKRFPAFPFFLAYGEIVGTQHSIAEETSKLAGKLAADYYQTNEKIVQTQTVLEQRLQESRARVQAMDIAPENETLQALESEMLGALQPQTRLSLQSFEITDFGHAREKMEQKLSEIQADFSKTAKGLVLGEKTIGSALKELTVGTNRLDEWETNRVFLENELQGGLVELCVQRIQQIEKETKEDAQDNETALELAAQTRFFVHEFKTASEVKQQLAYCAEALAAYKNLSLFRQDRQRFESEQKEKTGSCMAFLELAFESQPGLLEEERWRWERLQEQSSNSRTELGQLAGDCQALETAAKSRLTTSASWVELQTGFREIKRYWKGIQQLLLQTKKPQTFESMGKKVRNLEEFFSKDAPLTEKILPVLDEIKKQVSETRAALKESFGEQLRKFLETTVEKKSSAAQVPKANEANRLQTILVFSNPTEIEWNEPLAIELEGYWNQAMLADENTAVLTINSEGKKLGLVFSTVPVGIFPVTIETEENPTTVQKDVFLFVNQFKALMQKNIEIHTESDLRTLLVSTRLATTNSTNVWVVFQNREKPFVREQEKIQFQLENVSDKSTATVFFTVPNPLQVTQTISANQERIQWALEVRNTLPQAMQTPLVSLPLPEKGVQKISAQRENGEKLAIKHLETEIAIELPELAAFGEEKIVVAATIDNQQAWMQTVLEQTKQTINELLESSQPVLAQTAQRLLAELLAEQEKENFSIETVFRLAKDARELKEKENQHRFNEQQFVETIGNARQKIKQIRELAGVLKENGFLDVALELEQRIRTAEQQITEAGLFAQNKDFQAATTLVFRAITGLEEGTSKNTGLFEQQLEKAREKTAELTGIIAAFLSENAQATGIQKELQKQLLALQEKRFDSNPREFLQDWNQSQRVLQESQTAVNNLLKGKAEKRFEAAQRFKRLVFDGELEKKNGILLQWLEETPEKALSEENIFLPFRKADVEKRQQKIVALKSQKLESGFEEIQKTMQQEKFGQALEQMEKISKELGEKQKTAESLGKEIQENLDAVQQKAGVALEKAHATAAQGKLDSKQTAQLQKAQAAFEQKEFLKAWMLAKQIDSNSGSAPTGLFGLFDKIPIAIVPILVGAVLVIGIRLRKKESVAKEKHKIKIERIPNDL